MIVGSDAALNFDASAGRGWTVAVLLPAPASGDEMDQESIEYEYDARGRLVRETERDPMGLLRRELRIAYP